jgi:hypothetical protein
MATTEQLEWTANHDTAIFEWRLASLRRAGYPSGDAWLLAGEKHVDLRLAEKLLKTGCQPATAMRILL